MCWQENQTGSQVCRSKHYHGKWTLKIDGGNCKVEDIWKCVFWWVIRDHSITNWWNNNTFWKYPNNWKVHAVVLSALTQAFKFADIWLVYFPSLYSLPDSCCATPRCHKPLQEILSSRLLGDAQQCWPRRTRWALDGSLVAGGFTAWARSKSRTFDMDETPWLVVSLLMTKVVESFSLNSVLGVASATECTSCLVHWLDTSAINSWYNVLIGEGFWRYVRKFTISKVW